MFMAIFTVIYFRGLQTLTMVEQCTVCLFCHFHGDLFSRFSLSRENREKKKSLAKNGLQYLHVYKRTLYRNRYKSNFTILFLYTVREIHQNTVDKIYLLKDYRYSNNDYRHLILTHVVLLLLASSILMSILSFVLFLVIVSV